MFPERDLGEVITEIKTERSWGDGDTFCQGWEFKEAQKFFHMVKTLCLVQGMGPKNYGDVSSF